MSLSDIEREWYDDSGNRHWRLKSNPGARYSDREERFTARNIARESVNTICPLDNKTCNYQMIIPADPTDSKAFGIRFCRHNHRFYAGNAPCGKDLERKKKSSKAKSKRKCRCK